MSEIPVNVVTPNDIAIWYEMSKQLADLRVKESLLRKKVFGGLFPAPVEGSRNVHDLGNGYKLKATHVIQRDIDEGEFTARVPDFRAAGFDPNKLVRRKPELIKSAYNELTAEQKNLFDFALIIKPGSPQLEVVAPKAKKD